MYINKKEQEAVFSAIDFISTNIDGAGTETHVLYTDIIDQLRSIWKKSLKQYKRKKKVN